MQLPATKTDPVSLGMFSGEAAVGFVEEVPEKVPQQISREG